MEVSRKKKVSQKDVFVKSSDVGQRITHFRPDFVRHGGD